MLFIKRGRVQREVHAAPRCLSKDFPRIKSVAGPSGRPAVGFDPLLLIPAECLQATQPLLGCFETRDGFPAAELSHFTLCVVGHEWEPSGNG